MQAADSERRNTTSEISPMRSNVNKNDSQFGETKFDRYVSEHVPLAEIPSTRDSANKNNREQLMGGLEEIT